MTPVIKSISKESIEKVLDYVYFEDDCLPCTYYPGEGKFLILSGDNATGKSFFCKLLNQIFRSSEVDPMLVGMSGRTTSGIPRMFIYGSEDDMATGVNSLQTVITGISTCQSRENPHAIFWDEPDIGLSESYHKALGEYLSNFVSDLPENTKGVVLVTHAREVIRQLRHLNPHFIRFGDDLSLDQWLDNPVNPHTIEELLALKDRASHVYKAIKTRIPKRK